MEPQVILASNSPRRKELLEKMGVKFNIRVKKIDETYPPNLPPEEVAKYLSKKKSDAYKNDISEDELIITADTVVCIGQEVLNKPKDKDEALLMLRQLSGNSHQVITGVCLLTSTEQEVFSVSSLVVFKSLNNEEINHYLKSNAALDKAGSYGIQDWIGTIGIKQIDGSYENIVGLPTQELHNRFIKKGIRHHF